VLPGRSSTAVKFLPVPSEVLRTYRETLFTPALASAVPRKVAGPLGKDWYIAGVDTTTEGGAAASAGATNTPAVESASTNEPTTVLKHMVKGTTQIRNGPQGAVDVPGGKDGRYIQVQSRALQRVLVRQLSVLRTN